MDIDIDIDGFDRDLEKELEKQTGLRFGAQNEIPFTEFFPEEFMRLYTEFESMEAFLDGSPWEVEDQADFRAIPDGSFDDYVDEHTDFPSWEVMYQTAGKRLMERRLG